MQQAQEDIAELEAEFLLLQQEMDMLDEEISQLDTAK